MEGQVFRLRVIYKKGGRLAMLSHLELTHALERTVRRSGLPFALTQGFSPHMKLAYGSALPVGVGSTCEVFDVTLVRYVAPARALEALQAASSADLMCLSCEYVEPRAAAASVAFPYSVYEARFDVPLSSVTWPQVIEVMRKKKLKTLTVADYLIGDVVVAGDTVRFQLKSTNAGSLRPDLFLSSSTIVGEVDTPQLVKLTRIAQAESPFDDIASIDPSFAMTD